MLLYRRMFFAAAGLLTISGVAWSQAPASAPAQTPAPASARIRGVVDAIDGHEMQVTTRTGRIVSMKLAADAGATLIAPIAIDAIRPGSFIGTAAVAQPDGTLKALEIQVFPEAMRGVGEGHRPWDLGEGSSMTNGTVGDLKVANGRYLTLMYKGGEQKVFVPENAPIITYEKATMTDVKKGDHVIVTATRNTDESLTATRIGVGKDGLVPPM
jgi:lipoprotein-anchoring transpeptidase ErfK/SrfK